MNFKFIYEGICKKVLHSTLAVMQFTIGFMCIFASVQTLVDMNSSITSMNSYFKDGEYYSINYNHVINDIYARAEEKKLKQEVNELIELKKYFESSSDFEFLHISNDDMPIKKESALDNTILTYEEITHQDSEYLRVQAYSTNKKFLDRMEYSFIDGNTQGFDKISDTIPIILGNTYKDKYKVGDVIEGLDLDSIEAKAVKLKVVGVLERESYVFLNGVSSVANSLDNSIIFPYNHDVSYAIDNLESLEHGKITLINYLLHGYVVLNNDMGTEAINTKLDNHIYRLKLVSLDEQIKNQKIETFKSLASIVFTAILIVIFTLISIGVTMINSIIKDRAEFGINIMLGATIVDIRKRIIGELITLLGFSVLISLGLIFMIPIFKFSLIAIFITVAIMLFFMSIIIAVIIRYLNRYSVNDLIRRQE